MVIVCDSLGIGAAHDADAYGDTDADTLGHVSAAVDGLDLRLLGSWGIGNLTDVVGVPPVEPEAVIARLEPAGAGKDSTTGHWELMGVRTSQPFPVYPQGFPLDVIAPFSAAIGHPVLGNRAASGTVIIEDLGREHLETGAPIVYTSGDSVFQIAAHVDVVSLETLYAWCEKAREILDGPHRVGRVIARPFTGQPGLFERTSDRRDYAVDPPGTTVCDLLHASGIPVKGVGKIEDLFARRGVTWSTHSGDSESSMDAITRFLDDDGPALIFANLVDFDQSYGHRNDPLGYAHALEWFDEAVRSRVVPRLAEEDRIVITGDHGTDPTLTRSTDHTRERVPMIAWGPEIIGQDLGTLEMIDLGATILDLFGIDDPPSDPGRSFASHL